MSNPEPVPLLLTVKAFAARTSMHPRTISRWCQLGVLRSVVVNDGGIRLIPGTELQRLVDLANEGLELPATTNVS